MTNKTRSQQKYEIIEISFFSVDICLGSPRGMARNY